ncbi:MAG: hypothetical protein JW725_04470 [Candidatus Babeliaceae bacterium]|nr:hypothetical protein [Candidatus Babeliaceae bacterium]
MNKLKITVFVTGFLLMHTSLLIGMGKEQRKGCTIGTFITMLPVLKLKKEYDEYTQKIEEKRKKNLGALNTVANGMGKVVGFFKRLEKKVYGQDDNLRDIAADSLMEIQDVLLRAADISSCSWNNRVVSGRLESWFDSKLDFLVWQDMWYQWLILASNPVTFDVKEIDKKECKSYFSKIEADSKLLGKYLILLNDKNAKETELLCSLSDQASWKVFMKAIKIGKALFDARYLVLRDAAIALGLEGYIHEQGERKKFWERGLERTRKFLEVSKYTQSSEK